MSFHAALSAHLLADATLTALVGTDSEGRACVWPGVAPEGTPLPRVVHSIVTESPVVDLSGLDNAGAGSRDYRVQVDCYAADYDRAAQLAERVLQRMNSTASTFASAPSESGGGYNYEPETKLHRFVMEFECYYTPA